MMILPLQQQRPGVETGTLARKRPLRRFFSPPLFVMAGGAEQGLTLTSRLVLVFHLRIVRRPSVERCRRTPQLGVCHDLPFLGRCS